MSSSTALAGAGAERASDLPCTGLSVHRTRAEIEMRYVLGGSRSGPEGQVSGNGGLFGREAFGGGGRSLGPRRGGPRSSFRRLRVTSMP